MPHYTLPDVSEELKFVQSVQQGVIDIPRRDIIRLCSIETGDIYAMISRPPYRSLIDPQYKTTWIPAAGAASRYFMPQETQSLSPTQQADFERLYFNGKDQAIWFQTPRGQIPKGLLPFRPGCSFFQNVIQQFRNLGVTQNLILVVPQQFKQDFASQCPPDYPVAFIPAPHYSMTIRCLPSGEPLKEENGVFSWVPGGHGRLLPLLDEKYWPGIKGLFIYNIDNSFEEDAYPDLQALSYFYDLFYLLLQELRQGDPYEAPSEKLRFYHKTLLSYFMRDHIPLEPATVRELYQSWFFRTETHIDWHSEVRKPLVVMGAVEAQSDDQGGGFVIASPLSPLEGPMQRLSLEYGHFKHPCNVIFFNPSLFWVEPLPQTVIQNLWLHSQDWLVTQRSYQGLSVFYKERLLYEMLSQSSFCNTVIVALSRCVFKPNKTLIHTLSYQRSDL